MANRFEDELNRLKADRVASVDRASENRASLRRHAQEVAAQPPAVKHPGTPPESVFESDEVALLHEFLTFTQDHVLQDRVALNEYRLKKGVLAGLLGRYANFSTRGSGIAWATVGYPLGLIGNRPRTITTFPLPDSRTLDNAYLCKDGLLRYWDQPLASYDKPEPPDVLPTDAEGVVRLCIGHWEKRETFDEDWRHDPVSPRSLVFVAEPLEERLIGMVASTVMKNA